MIVLSLKQKIPTDTSRDFNYKLVQLSNHFFSY